MKNQMGERNQQNEARLVPNIYIDVVDNRLMQLKLAGGKKKNGHLTRRSADALHPPLVPGGGRCTDGIFKARLIANAMSTWLTNATLSDPVREGAVMSQ